MDKVLSSLTLVKVVKSKNRKCRIHKDNSQKAKIKINSEIPQILVLKKKKNRNSQKVNLKEKSEFPEQSGFLNQSEFNEESEYKEKARILRVRFLKCI